MSNWNIHSPTATQNVRLVQLEGGDIRLDARVPHAASHVRVEGEAQCFDDETAIQGAIEVDGSLVIHDQGVGVWSTLGYLVEDDGGVLCGRHGGGCVL